MELRHVAAHLLNVDVLELDAAREREEGDDVAGVILDGMPAQAALVGEMLKIPAQ
jgi:hypothetical protein